MCENIKGCLEYFSPTPMPTRRSLPLPPEFILKRHDYEILAPNIKISAPKFKYLVSKVALYSNITDKIQTEWICVPLKTSCFVRKKLPTKLIRNPTPPAISVSKKLELTPLGKHRNSIETWQGVGGKPKIVAKRDLSVYNSAWRAFFRWTLNFILLPEDWVCWLSPNIWRDTVSKWTHRLLKEVAIWKEACIVHVGAFIHDYQGDEASWSRKCLSWKDCPSAWAQLSTDNVNFCTRSRPYQREASRPSGPGRDFFRFF